MTEDDIKKLTEGVVETIRKTVNGKIDAISKKLDEHNERHENDMLEVREHMKETRPVLDAVKGGRVIGETFKWVAMVGASIILIWNWIKGQ